MLSFEYVKLAPAASTGTLPSVHAVTFTSGSVGSFSHSQYRSSQMRRVRRVASSGVECMHLRISSGVPYWYTRVTRFERVSAELRREGHGVVYCCRRAIESVVVDDEPTNSTSRCPSEPGKPHHSSESSSGGRCLQRHNSSCSMTQPSIPDEANQVLRCW